MWDRQYFTSLAMFVAAVIATLAGLTLLLLWLGWVGLVGFAAALAQTGKFARLGAGDGLELWRRR